MTAYDPYDEARRPSTADSGPWAVHLPLAWRAIADPDGPYDLPAKPHPTHNLTADRSANGLIAWWSPLLHVLMYGCGWPRPDLGAARWLAAGRPSLDSRLRVVNRWWGRHVGELLTWSANQSFRSILEITNLSLGTDVDYEPLPHERINQLQQAYDWDEDASRTVWGSDILGIGGDVMHLRDHVTLPLAEPGHHELVIGTAPTQVRPGRAVLLLDGYLGWYSALHQRGHELSSKPGHRSWQVDVVCRPLGWLGTFRRSRRSGRWFAGQHRWHELGMSGADGDD